MGHTAIYLDTSAVLRAVLEGGTTPLIEQRLRDARVLVTSRLSRVEAARALIRLRQLGTIPESRLAEATLAIDDLWARCEIWELTPAVCALAEQITPAGLLRTLAALQLATYLLARREIDGLELLTADQRLAAAAEAV
jgi:predicted nucleic acid-binding protein